MLKCKVCGTTLQDEIVEEFDYGINQDISSIREVSSCRCPKCDMLYLVRREYTLTNECFAED